MANGDKPKAGQGAELLTLAATLGVDVAILVALQKKGVLGAPPIDYTTLLNQILTAIKAITPGGTFPTSILTPWVADDPVNIFSQSIRNIGIFLSDSLVDYRNGKRLLFKIESSLNQAVSIQLIGNYNQSFNLAVDINGPIAVPPNGNASIGLAWDDWHPYIGARITTLVAPASGILNIWSVMQR